MKNKITAKENINQELLSLTICSLISYAPIIYFFNIVTNMLIGDGFIYDTLFCYIVLLILILRSLNVVLKRIKVEIFFIALLILMTYLITYLFFDLNRKYMFSSVLDIMGNPLYIILIFNFTSYLFTRYITDYSVINSYLKKFSYTVVILSAISYFLLLSKNNQPQYMVFSYNMLLHTLYLFIYFLDYKSVVAGIVSVIGILVIFVSGARGPLVIFIFTVIVYYLFRREKPIIKTVSLFIASIFTLVIYNNFNFIFTIINSLVTKFGINSRTIQKIIANEFLNSSGRDIIFFEQIKAITFFGKGMFGDRVITNSYAHNIIIEILVQYGYLFGFFMLIAILFIIMFGLISKNRKINSLSIIFISTGFLKLFLSGSYLNQEPSFYILLGLGINAFMERRNKKIENSLAH